MNLSVSSQTTRLRTDPLGPVAPHCSTRDPGGRVGPRSKGWRWVGLGVGLGFRGRRWVGLGVGLGIFKVGGVGSGDPAVVLHLKGMSWPYKLYIYIACDFTDNSD